MGSCAVILTSFEIKCPPTAYIHCLWGVLLCDWLSSGLCLMTSDHWVDPEVRLWPFPPFQGHPHWESTLFWTLEVLLGLRNVFLNFDVDPQPQVTRGRKKILRQEQIHLHLPDITLQNILYIYTIWCIYWILPRHFPQMMHIVVAYLIVQETLAAADVNVSHLQSVAQWMNMALDHCRALWGVAGCCPDGHFSHEGNGFDEKNQQLLREV